MVHPLFFSPCDWEVAHLVSILATTRPRYLYHSALAEDGAYIVEHWIGKNPEESGFPYILANEFICAQLAAEMGLMVPECKVQGIGQQTWFLSSYIPHESFTYGKFKQCRNIGDVPLLLLFDLWVCNEDRWDSNLLICRPEDDPDTYEFVVIDHSHALLGDANLPYSALDINPKDCFTFNELTEQITSHADWDPALSALRGLHDEVIMDVVNALPDVARGGLDTEWLIKRLIQRREQVASLLEHARALGCFPYWV